MKKSFRKALALILAVLTLFSCFSIGATAKQGEIAVSGVCGDNAYWSFDKETGTLSITGSGELYDFTCHGTSDGVIVDIPWYYYWQDIKNVEVADGITGIGSYAFAFCLNLTKVTAETVQNVGISAFAGCISLESISLPSAKIIGEDAFRICLNLKDVQLPKAEVIGDDAFEWSVSVEELNLPSLMSNEDGLFSSGELNFIKKVYLGENLNNFSCTNIGYADKQEVYFYGKNTIITDGFGYIRNKITDSFDLDEFKEYLEAALNYWVKATVDNDEEAFAKYEESEEKMQETFQTYAIFYDEPIIDENLTVYGYTGSTAETYATENGIKFIALDDTEDGDVIITAPETDEADFVVVEIGDKNDLDYVLVESLISGGLTGLYDISMVDSEGNAVQPEFTVKVKLPIGNKQGNFTVYRVEEDGTLTNMNAYRDGEYMIFETDHFSLYVIVSDTETDSDTDTDTDADTDGCGEDCTCLCHAHVIFHFIVKILNTLLKWFGNNPICYCS